MKILNNFENWEKLNELNINKIVNSNLICDNIYNIIGEKYRDKTYGKLRYFIKFGKKDNIIPFLKQQIDITLNQEEKIRDLL